MAGANGNGNGHGNGAKGVRPGANKAHDTIRARNEAKQARFLKNYAVLGTITAACQAAGVGRTTFYEWLEEDATFKAKYEHAKEDVADSLEQEAIRRCRDGVDEPVYQKGELVGTIRRYSDTLMMFMLSALKPDRFRRKAAAAELPETESETKPVVNFNAATDERAKPRRFFTAPTESSN